MAQEQDKTNDFNRVELTGHLARDPLICYTKSDTPRMYVLFTLAVNERPKGGKPHTNYIPCRAFREIAQRISTMKKGDSIRSGVAMLKQESWKDKNTGEFREKIYVLVFSLGTEKRREPTKMPGRDPFDAEMPF